MTVPVATQANATIVRIIDGDTLECRVPILEGATVGRPLPRQWSEAVAAVAENRQFMTVAGRRSRTRPGPDGAPRTDSLDIRWGEDWRYLVTTYPDIRSYLLRVARDAWDAGHRADRDTPNPYWLDPDIAGHDDTPPTSIPLLGATVDKIAPYWKAVTAFLVPLIGGVIAAMQDNTPGNSTITGQEWLGIALLALVTGGSVFGVPNKDPKGVKQSESVQPPGA
jgi:hypothetical protein